jgi:hypothetical protein
VAASIHGVDTEPTRFSGRSEVEAAELRGDVRTRPALAAARRDRLLE